MALITSLLSKPKSLAGNPIDWVSTHRYHHQFCDSDRDPHSPIEGFWFSHMSWLFDTDTVVERCGEPTNVGDLRQQPFYKFLQGTYILHPIALGVLLYALGGFPFLVWGMGVRIVWVYHITWLVNSACHVWGKQAWNTGDLSRNNWWVALLAFGEGWHNNHHAFEYSARHGLEWWQLDMTWKRAFRKRQRSCTRRVVIEALRKLLVCTNEGHGKPSYIVTPIVEARRVTPGVVLELTSHRTPT
ncbi:Fatty acid desaturase 5 [Theobroma cacao]|uniref:Fatty acid desaturase 5 n=1 Tax=Theobroma cacao TaxID=3641 RepID=A0A061G8D0_THECC|nr:Fatty acid desaturase 5 [Theobroma cacao]